MENYNILFRLHALLFLLTSVSGWISVYFLKELWGYRDYELSYPIQVSIVCVVIYLGSLIFFYNVFSRFKSKKLVLPYRFSLGANILCLIPYAVAFFIFLYFSMRNSSYLSAGNAGLPGGTVIAFMLTWVPAIFMLQQRRLGIILAFVSALAFAIGMVRFNIVILFILYIASYRGRLNFVSLARVGVLFLSLVVAVSMFRIDSGDEVASEIDNLWVANLASNLGSEWRDGIFGLVRLPESGIEEARNYHVESLILPGIPFVTYLPGINLDALRDKQLYHLYVTEANLDSAGFTGIRVGMLWEMFYFYSYFGVVLLAALNGFFLAAFNFLRDNDALSFARIVMPIASIYGIVGQSSMYLGVFVQYVIFSVASIYVLRSLSKVVSLNR